VSAFVLWLQDQALVREHFDFKDVRTPFNHLHLTSLTWPLPVSTTECNHTTTFLRWPFPVTTLLECHHRHVCFAQLLNCCVFECLNESNRWRSSGSSCVPS
jgi:hypothetical protein